MIANGSVGWGWHRDPYRIHEDRYLSVGGLPTKLVRDGGCESYDPPPEDTVPNPADVDALRPLCFAGPLPEAKVKSTLT
jgi:hypothetical protein